MSVRFTPSHRGGSGPPLLLLHGILDTWRTWELVLPMLERRFDVLALTLPGHAGGPEYDAAGGWDGALDLIEEQMRTAGFELPAICGNSLGGYLAMRLAARGRAKSVVALAPAGGWPRGSRMMANVFELQQGIIAAAPRLAPHALAIATRPRGRRQLSRTMTVRYEHLPPELLAHQSLAIAHAADSLAGMVRLASDVDWDLDAQAIRCPVRIVWGDADRLLRWSGSATMYREHWLPHADWVLLDDVGHGPQLDVPEATADLIASFA